MIYLCKNADEQKVNYLYLSTDLTFLFNENMYISEGMILLEITHEEYDYIFNYDVNKNGPGCYCKEIIHKLPPEKLKPDFFFKSKDKKCLLFNENEFRDVPHSFKKESYFQWNKKSYNSKYNKS